MKNILEVIKKAPKDHVYYCTVIGDCNVEIIKNTVFPITVRDVNNEGSVGLTKEGKYFDDCISSGECILFPSRDNRDWEAFERELDGTKEAVQYVPVSENGVLSGYYQVVGITEINLDHEDYKEIPYIYFQINGEKYRVYTEEIKRLALGGTEDEKCHVFGQSFDGTPKIVWDDNTKKIIKMAKKWQREIEKIEKHWKEVEPMMRYMAQRVNEMYEEYKEYQRRNNNDKRTD